MPLIDVIDNNGRISGSVCYRNGSLVRFCVDIGFGKQKYQYTTQFERIEPSLARYEEIPLFFNQKKRLRIVFKDGREFTLRREFKI
jgi:hypothetical protein